MKLNQKQKSTTYATMRPKIGSVIQLLFTHL